jgi:hypothetical protein
MPGRNVFNAISVTGGQTLKYVLKLTMRNCLDDSTTRLS